MSGFFAMGGYAAYVWPSYAVAAVLLAGVWIASVRSLRAREAELEKAEPGSRHRDSSRGAPT
jgi:heme exporter protein D